MTIKRLVTAEEHSMLVELMDSHPNIIYQNTAWDTIDVTSLAKEDKDAHDKVSTLLKEVVVGFSYFDHFKVTKDTRRGIRLHYDYSAAKDCKNATYFVGVGYCLIEELLNGFSDV